MPGRRFFDLSIADTPEGWRKAVRAISQSDAISRTGPSIRGNRAHQRMQPEVQDLLLIKTEVIPTQEERVYGVGFVQTSGG